MFLKEVTKKGIFISLIITALGFFSSAKAFVDRYGVFCCDYDYCTGWDPCLLGAFDVGGAFLLWRPSLDLFTIAVLNDDVDHEDREVIAKALCPSWDLGMRLWMDKPFIFQMNDALSTTWTGIYSRDSTSCSVKEGEGTLQAPHLISPTLSFRQLSLKWKASYHDYDILYSYTCDCGGGHLFRPFFGYAGLVFNHKVRLKGTPLDSQFQRAEMNWKSELCAHGIRFGADYSCPMTSCLSLFGQSSATILVGLPHVAHTQLLVGSEGQLIQTVHCEENRRSCSYPGFHLAVGGDYHRYFYGAHISFRVGYEYILWDNLPSPRRFVDATGTAKAANHTDSINRPFGWEGVMVALTLYL